MRLTNVSQMDVQPGRLLSYRLHVEDLPEPHDQMPVSFDQGRHVSFGSRPGTWMAASFRLPGAASRETIAEAWHCVIARHSTLRTAFSRDPRQRASAPAVRPSDVCGGPDTDLVLTPLEVLGGMWEPLDTPWAAWDHEEDDSRADANPVPAEEASTMTAGGIRAALRAHFDAVCEPFARPSHRLCLIEDPADGGHSQIVIGSDHAHVDAWSLLVLMRDLSTAIEDLVAGGPSAQDRPAPESFAAHSASLEQRSCPPEDVVSRWTEILEAGGGAMPTFPLDLGDPAAPAAEVVEVRDVFDAEELAAVESHAEEGGVRLIAVAVSVMTRLAHELVGEPLRAVFPVHSRYEPRWYDSVGWFITNSVIESSDTSYEACRAAVKEAVRLGSHPLAPIMRPYGGMPQDPGMFAMSWLDHRKLPVNVPETLRPQHISAVIRTDGVMVWFVINESGMHLRCRYPDTRQARRAMRTWLAGLVYGLRGPLEGMQKPAGRRRTPERAS
ncbi:peptide synthetase [Nesterenkonia sp. NBAIMH1]|uniref:peptide synthetase n=1 Tax=Nesterenkonia sp. NBAIMH1 TaxID=2600320 RepID=UPI0011B4B3CE|nr:peptide synthetase [Nesterenkonia sp. NBAIMH1]